VEIGTTDRHRQTVGAIAEIPFEHRQSVGAIDFSDAVFQNYISSRSYSVSKCGVCEKVTNPVRCFTCKQDFCSKCDMITHRKLVLHNREVCENGENLKFLRQNEFISEDGYITVEGNSAFLNYICRLIIILY
jgi:hypothetical protein